MRKCICIGRQYGSGGRRIALKAAENIGIRCYDSELLTKAITDSGITSNQLLEEADEKTASWMYTALYEGSNKEYYGKNPNDILFSAQKKIILEIAAREDCILVGRCADHILRRQKDCQMTSIFINAPMDYRIREIMSRENVNDKDAAKLIRKTDRQRKIYYEYYTGNDWGKPSDYDIMLNAQSMGEERILKLIGHIYNS